VPGSRRWLPVVVAALCVSAVAGSGVGEAASTGGAASPASTCGKAVGKGKLTIVSDLPLRGSLSLAATEINRAATLVLQQAKYRAGKFTVSFAACDDSTAQTGMWDPETCASNARGFARTRNVVGLLGTYDLGCSMIEMPITNRAPGGGIAMVSPADTYGGLTHKTPAFGEPDKYFPTGARNYARVAVPDGYQAAAAALFARSKAWKKIYVLNDGTPYGEAMASSFASAAKALGITILGNDAWDEAAPNYQAEFQSIQGTNPDAVFLGGIVSNNGGQVIKDKVVVLGDNSKVGLLGVAGFDAHETIADAGPASDRMYVTSVGSSASDLSSPAGKAFARAFRKAYKVSSLPAPVGDGAEAMQVLLAAIARSDGTRAGIAKSLYNLSVPKSVLGPARIDAYGDPVYGDPEQSQVRVQRISNGTVGTVTFEKPSAALALKAAGP
jgi:branched-chain amino acid transport system substrate-binding protein